MDFGLDVLTAEQRERRMREVEAEVAQLVGWGSEEVGKSDEKPIGTVRKIMKKHGENMEK